METNKSVRPAHILMVEDNPDDIYLTEIVLKEAKVIANFEIVSDGEKAMQYLRKEAPYTNVQRPDLILLDLNLPKKDGREVLQDIRDDEMLRSIPVVVLSTSAADRDIIKTYDLDANCYLVKPIDMEQILALVASINTFSIQIVISD